MHPYFMSTRAVLLVLVVAVACLIVLSSSAKQYWAPKHLTDERIAQVCQQTNTCSSGTLLMQPAEGSPYGLFKNVVQRNLQVATQPGQWNEAHFVQGLTAVESWLVMPIGVTLKPAVAIPSKSKKEGK